MKKKKNLFKDIFVCVTKYNILYIQYIQPNILEQDKASENRSKMYYNWMMH